MKKGYYKNNSNMTEIKPLLFYTSSKEIEKKIPNDDKINKVSVEWNLKFETNNGTYHSPNFSIPLANNQYEANQLFVGFGKILEVSFWGLLLGVGLKAIFD